MSIRGIDILPTAQSAQGYDFAGAVAVVIDVLRATSVITMAAHNGAAAIVPVLSPDEGFALAERVGRANVTLGGERNADRIPGFDLGNSPQAYTPAVVGGKTVILTTTNGTVALRASQGAKAVVAASMLNYRAAALRALSIARDSDAEKIVFVCSGNYGALTLEDCWCAAVMADVVLAECPDGSVNLLTDEAIALHNLTYGRTPADDALACQSRHYAKLLAKGYAADADVCLRQPDSIVTVPVMGADGALRAQD